MGLACLLGGHRYELIEITDNWKVYQCTRCLNRQIVFREIVADDVWGALETRGGA